MRKEDYELYGILPAETNGITWNSTWNLFFFLKKVTVLFSRPSNWLRQTHEEYLKSFSSRKIKQLEILIESEKNPFQQHPNSVWLNNKGL